MKDMGLGDEGRIWNEGGHGGGGGVLTGFLHVRDLTV